MQITVAEIHIDNPKIKNNAIDKISKLAKYHSSIEKIEIRLIFKKNRTKPYCCELNIDIPGKNLELIDFEDSIDAAVDKAFERAKRLLVKDKEKKTSKNHTAAKAAKSKSLRTV